MKRENLSGLLAPDALAAFNTRQVILYENLSLTVPVEVKLGNATQIFINASYPISIAFGTGKGKQQFQQISGVKQLYLNRKVETLFIYKGIAATTDPAGNALTGMVCIYASGADQLLTPFWPIDYLPNYAHLGQDSWANLATSVEVFLDTSTIAVSNVILTRWKCTMGAATLIRDAGLMYITVGGTRTMIFRVDNTNTGVTGGVASNFDLIFNPGIIMPAKFEYFLLGNSNAGAAAPIVSTFWMKLL
jgi:hypothetical protein